MSNINSFLENTVTVSAPKRSGGTLITRLLDNQPGLIHVIDEGFFWEHAYTFWKNGQEKLFVDMFRKFTPEQIEESIKSKGLLPWCDGTYEQIYPKPWSLNINWDRNIFLAGLADLKSAQTISDIWNGIIKAYSNAMTGRYKDSKIGYLFSGDYGRAMIVTKYTLEKSKGIFIMRNPYYAMESLKKARIVRNAKILHPFNFTQSLSYYFFFWENREKILHKDTLLIRFEDIVTDTKGTMQKVANHIGIEYSDNMLYPTLLGKPWGGDSSFHKLKGVDKSTINRKIQTLDDTEIDFIGQHLKPIIEYFDYQIPEIDNK
jgi:hypothetical protein